MFLFRSFIFGFGLFLICQATPGQAEPAYIGTDACIACHTDEAKAWEGSHHDLAWTPPSEATILADFGDTSFTLDGVTSRFSREGEDFIIESDGPDGEMTRYPVAAVIGVAPLQQYAVETEPGRLQSFDVPWDIVRKEWFHMYPEQGLNAQNGLHWTGSYKTWNARCAECHATDYQRNYDPQTRSYSSTQAEIGVGCEACHGPGSAHVDWANDVPSREAQNTLTDTRLTVDYAAGDGEVLIQQCAGCHSRREPLLGGSPAPGTPFHDAYRLSTLRAPIYEPDGQILDEVYVYGSFLQSKMYAKGVTCKNCHDVHAANLEAEGNAVCTTCHSEAGNSDFPSLPLAEYDSAKHHFHEVDSKGAECKSCHMIERVYMGVDGRRDHSFRVPRPDLTAKTGAPNACNDCHADQSPQWAARQVERWYPNSTNRGSHFSEVFFAARQGRPEMGRLLADLALYDGLPAIVRATALEQLQAYITPELADAVAPLLRDKNPMVRANTVPLQRSAKPQDMIARLFPLLEDTRRVVRITAARELLTTPASGLSGDQRSAMSRAFGEWQNALQTRLDYPETHMQLGGIALTTRNFAGARAAFLEAVRMDPQMVQAWSIIIRLSLAMEEPDAARAALVEAQAANPGDPTIAGLAAQIP
ncbi:Doubled CXXCH motif (Paired_CXXCH_1) [Shimia gijangensis]|uniref:Doubled CXXCH motif (Paired_CXXCH_1) n=1 Tax=Shimia gijangensis TaxID=1470563 RepID=A0A1M6I8R8_9RHOB|nr:multiheme c-type cytochrome [Shimia gijangensis]SHJ30822.1 Doubled CXXCH motif (Paired_CXXCH_1) [Shimia gijangensis]